MPNTSATGGYLGPTTTAPAYDSALDRLFQQAVVGITGLAGARVIPRWQPNPPKQPEPSIDWCSIGIHRIDGGSSRSIVHNSSGNGSDTLRRYETLEVVASFYGPNGSGNAALLSDGLTIPQNMEALASVGIEHIETSEITPAPALVNEQWVRKFDIRLTFSREVRRTYPVFNLLSAEGTIVADDGNANAWNTEN